MRDERPGLTERYGVAVNASTLELEDGRDTPLERIVEMGTALRHMKKAALGEADRIANELAPWLWRADYGRDRKTGLAQACTIFTQWLMLKPYMEEIERIDAGIVRRFATVVVHEWLTRTCAACGGSGWQGVTDNGKRVHASVLGRNCRKAICLHCRGRGRPTDSPKLRGRYLGTDRRKISDGEYRTLWHRQFVLARLELREISIRPREPLHALRKKPADTTCVP